MLRRVVLMRIENDQVPSEPGAVTSLDLGDNLATLLEGWSVVSHNVNQQLSGEMIVSLYCER